MKSLLKFLAVVYVLFRMADCSNEERKKKLQEELELLPKRTAPAIHEPVREAIPSPKSGRDVHIDRSWEKEDDSLRRIFDRNNMDYDQYHNPDDDDQAVSH